MGNMQISASGKAVGQAVVHKGQTYTFCGHEPYTTKAGKSVMLDCWSAQCAECGAEFRFKTTPATSFKPNRRCPAHKAPLRRVKELA